VELANVHFISESSSEEDKAKCDDGEGESASTGNPEADAGEVCVFLAEGVVTPTVSFNPGGELGAGKTGAVLFWVENATGFGTFAVTAP
jgi:hypothetical protein